MKITLLFCDLNSDFIKAIKKEKKKRKDRTKEKYYVQTFIGDIRKFEMDKCAWVSPANSLGYMDGGIDKIYTKMFDGIQNEVQKRIRKHNQKTALGRYYISVGSALLIQNDALQEKNQYLISAPTMFLPQDVSDTQNAYWAMRATLKVVDKANIILQEKIETIIIPGLCIGYGCMSSKTSVCQIFQAINDHILDKQMSNEKISDPFSVICDANQK